MIRITYQLRREATVQNGNREIALRFFLHFFAKAKWKMVKSFKWNYMFCWFNILLEYYNFYVRVHFIKYSILRFSFASNSTLMCECSGVNFRMDLHFCWKRVFFFLLLHIKICGHWGSFLLRLNSDVLDFILLSWLCLDLVYIFIVL